MTTALTWTFEGPTQGVVNAEGNQIHLSLRVTDTSNQLLGTSPSVMKSVGRPDHIGTIRRWRYRGSFATLLDQNGTNPATPDGLVSTVFATQMSEVQYDGTHYFVTFKVVLSLSQLGQMAIHPLGTPPTAPEILRLMNNAPLGIGDSWFTLHVPSGSSSFSEDAPDWTNIPLDVSAIGRLPNPSSHLKLNVDSEAEWVKHDAGVSPLSTWNDLSGSGNNLSREDDPELRNANLSAIRPQPVVRFDAGTTTGVDAEKLASPPSFNGNATIGVVIVPDPRTTAATIVGRYNSPSGLSWRLYYIDDGAIPPHRQVVFQGQSSAIFSNPFDLDPADGPVLVLMRRQSIAGPNLEVWINGRAQAIASSAHPMAGGAGPLYVGAREVTATPTLGDGFKGDINQVALYDTNVDLLAFSLIMHQMASRTLINLGTPIPPAWQNQPYSDSNPTANRRLLRRPIAVINLYSGDYDKNMFGQSRAWRAAPDNTGSPDIESLKNSIREAFNGCDQFEIAFNRPGGRYRDNPVTSYVFEEFDANHRLITDNQWAAMSALWTFFNLDDHNDDSDRNANNYRKRRGWMYTGAGLPLKDGDGTLETTGRMGNRQVAPATPGIYKSTLLDPWVDTSPGAHGDPRYRCLLVDAAEHFFGKFVELVHDSSVYGNFTLIGEAIPTDEAARKGAPWLAMTSNDSAPWWKLDAADDAPKRALGYNFNWTNEWLLRPICFGILGDKMQNIFGAGVTPGSNAGNDGNDLPIGVIYSLVLKGATPVAWYSDTYIKVGAAWNYATNRVAPSRHVRCPRLLRSARA